MEDARHATGSRPLEIRRVSIDSLHLDPANARTHPDENLDAIRASIQRFGQAEPLVVQRSTGRVIGGNGRLAVMKTLGWSECDVVELDVDDLTATSLGIALNRTAETAQWNEETLARLLQDLKAEDALDGVGFDTDDIDALLESIDGGVETGECDEDDVPEPPPVATTQPGDVWRLGRHRLLCGDSASPSDVDRLLAGQSIQLVNTDPPYNVKVEPRSNNAIAAGVSSFGKSTHHQKLDVARHPSKRKGTTKQMRPKRPLRNCERGRPPGRAEVDARTRVTSPRLLLVRWFWPRSYWATAIGCCRDWARSTRREESAWTAPVDLRVRRSDAVRDRHLHVALLVDSEVARCVPLIQQLGDPAFDATQGGEWLRLVSYEEDEVLRLAGWRPAASCSRLAVAALGSARPAFARSLRLPSSTLFPR